MNHHITMPCLMKRSSLTPESFLRSRMNATFASMTNHTYNNRSNCTLQELAACRIQGKKLRCDLRKELGISSFEKKLQTKLRFDLRRELGISPLAKTKQTIHWKRPKKRQRASATSTPIEAGHALNKRTRIPRWWGGWTEIESIYMKIYNPLGCYNICSIVSS